MSNSRSFYLKLGASVLFVMVASFLAAAKFSGRDSVDDQITIGKTSDVKASEIQRHKTASWDWYWAFSDLRSLTATKHRVWKKEDEIKKLVGAGAVAVGIEELREIKSELAQKEKSYQEKLAKGMAADPSGYEKFSQNTNEWLDTVNQAHINYRFARNSDQIKDTHAIYLDILYKTEVELP